MNNKKEVFNYLVFGVLTTIVNIASYGLLTKIMNIDYKVATTIAWLLSVIFAFITNKMFVFKSLSIGIDTLIKEFSSFLFFRILSYFIDLAMMIVLVEWVRMDDVLAKIFANIVVVVLNYIASRYFIFQKAN
ncbi:GtrA family protein [Bacillus sp. T3]|uniref:GtrA family protein n=1 Tax=Bacillus sp. T3 TaxID=467262 RepID=UPI002981CC96|nr:GtrA family protein [Bacillus sp. T3]